MMTMTTSTAAVEKFDVEGLGFSENNDLNLPSPSHVNGNDSGISVGSIDAIDEENPSGGSITVTSSDEEKRKAVETTIMVQLNPAECRLTLLHENREIEPFRITGSTGGSTIPLKMGTVRDKLLVFGEEALAYENAQLKNPEFWRKRFTGFNLWEELLDSREIIKIFIYDNMPLYAKIELMLGLYLSHLKKIVENSLNNADCPKIHDINKIVILVPLWYKSIHRQRMKDAAKIGGFVESFIVNETSALAIIHVAAKRLFPGTPVNVLVFSEDAESTNLTFYSCKADNAKMLAATGTRISSWESRNSGNAHSRDVEKIKHEEIMNKVNRKERELSLQKDIFAYLLEEIQHQLPNDIDPVLFTDCIMLSHSEQNDWKINMQDVLQRKAITHYHNVGTPPVGIAKQNWHLPVLSLQNFVGAGEFKIPDLVPFALRQSISLLVSGDEALKVEGKIKKDLNGKLTVYPMQHSVFYQNDIMGESWEVGTLQVTPVLFCDHDYPVIEANFQQSWEGIFQLESVTASAARGTRKKTLSSQKGDYYWKSSNLNASKIEECRKKLEDMRRCTARYEEERSKIVEALWQICGDISESLFYSNHSRRLAGKRKVEMEKKVDDTLKMLKKIIMDDLMEVSRDELKNQLREWRRENRLYFKKVCDK